MSDPIHQPTIRRGLDESPWDEEEPQPEKEPIRLPRPPQRGNRAAAQVMSEGAILSTLLMIALPGNLFGADYREVVAVPLGAALLGVGACYAALSVFSEDESEDRREGRARMIGLLAVFFAIGLYTWVKFGDAPPRPYLSFAPTSVIQSVEL